MTPDKDQNSQSKTNSNPKKDKSQMRHHQKFVNYQTKKPGSPSTDKNDQDQVKKQDNLDPLNNLKNRSNNSVIGDKNISRPVNSNTSEKLETEVNQENKVNDESLIEAKITTLKAEAADWQDKALRATADLENIKKQNILDIEQAKKSSKKGIALSVITFLNTLNLAFNFPPQSEDEKVKKFIQTLKFSFDQAIRDLSNYRVEVIVPKIGDSFNPETMSVANPESVENQDSDIKIKQVVSLGAKIDSQLVQPAMVIV